jgi:hypothetical protein
LEGQFDGRAHRSFDCGAADLAVALGGVAVTDGEEGAGTGDGEVEG